MWKAPGLIPTLVAVLAAFGGWSLLLPVIPQAILDDGRGAGLAGAYTGVFMAATVLTQTQTPRMLRRFGYGQTMFVSGLLLGLPTFLHLFGTDAALVLGIAVIRGMGFGALTVAESALIAELVPLKFLGKASGALGVAVGVAQLTCLPLGLAIAHWTGTYQWVYVLGGVISLVGSAMALLIPKLKAAAKTTKGTKTAKGTAPEVAGKPATELPAGDPGPAENVPTWKLVAVPALAMGTTAMGFGGISAFLAPAAREIDLVAGAIVAGAALSVMGGAQMVFRYIAGAWADRKGKAGTLIIGALAAGVVGLIFMALVVYAGWSAWWLLGAAAFYGAGFGMVQNEALLLMFARLPRERTAEASAYWNMAFDSGTGTGSFVLGLVAGVALQPYPAVFAVAAGLMSIGLVAAILDHIVGAHRVAERHNTRATLRKLGGAVVKRKPVSETRPETDGRD
ncbi:MFS transporter [Corynebacterium xerosis]|uniref:MFS transporter n=2 Tax=Corynebacterium xerosis TaxID=1725 RepID=A0A7X9SWP4_9CORY|nr:MFS transporter [Corynebacterium xerosis]NMF09207.1 MFS transporter [Corynebacterium xerosis]